jgi:hypothetical protein
MNGWMSCHTKRTGQLPNESQQPKQRQERAANKHGGSSSSKFEEKQQFKRLTPSAERLLCTVPKYNELYCAAYVAVQFLVPYQSSANKRREKQTDHNEGQQVSWRGVRRHHSW